MRTLNWFGRIPSVFVMVVLSVAATVHAADPSAASKPQPADTNRMAALLTQEMTVDNRVRDIVTELIELNRSLQTARTAAMREDAELKALTAELEQKQAELEQKLAAKYPKVGEMARERDRLMQEHARLHAQLMDLRKQREIAAEGVR